jgi:hypothetical protein
MRCVLELRDPRGARVSPQIGAGPPAGPDDLRAAQERSRLLGTELTRVQAAATAWRNGLAGLLTALAGFSLIKGQSDISQLARPWAAAAGLLLLAAFLAGVAGALLLIRAAAGFPVLTPVSRLRSRSADDHTEAKGAVWALQAGIALTVICAGLLVAAVGVTWYGPGRTPPALQITTPAGTRCGTLLQLNRGRATVAGRGGTSTVTLQPGDTVRPVTGCPP